MTNETAGPDTSTHGTGVPWREFFGGPILGPFRVRIAVEALIDRIERGAAAPGAGR